jgi:hypothetical protein
MLPKAYNTRHAPKRARKFPQSQACSPRVEWGFRERLGTENVDRKGDFLS